MTAVALVLIGIAIPVIVVNWIVLVQWYVARKRASMILLAGGFLGFVGCALLPPVGYKVGFVALALDPGCFSFLGLPNLVEILIRALRRGRGGTQARR